VAEKKTIEDLLAARAEREARAEAVKAAHERLLLELDDRFSTDLGPREVAWDWINEENTAEVGPICLKLAEPVTFKAFQSKTGATYEDAMAFVTPNVVYPTKDTWTAVAVQRQALVFRAAGALMSLAGVHKETFRKKP
jgi:hypothetical protein